MEGDFADVDLEEKSLEDEIQQLAHDKRTDRILSVILKGGPNLRCVTGLIYVVFIGN